MLDFVDLTVFDPVVAEAMKAVAAVVDGSGSFEDFEKAQQAFYDVVGDHPQVMEAELAMGW